MIEGELKNLLNCLGDPNPDVRQAAMVALVKAGETSAIPALGTMADSDPDPKLRYYAKKGLQILKTAKAPREQEIRETEPRPAENMAAQTQQDDGARRELVLGNIDSTDRSRRILAIKGAIALEDRDLVSVLVKRLPVEADPFVTSLVVSAIGLLGRSSDSNFVTPMLEHPDPRVRANAVEAVERLGDPDSLGLVIPLLNDSDNRCRANAISALKNHAGVNVFNHLQKMICSDQVWMQDSAAYVLGLIESRNSVLLLREAHESRHEVVRTQARKSLERLAEKGNRDAAGALDDFFGSKPPCQGEDSKEAARSLFDELEAETGAGVVDPNGSRSQAAGNPRLLAGLLRAMEVRTGPARKQDSNINSIEAVFGIAGKSRVSSLVMEASFLKAGGRPATRSADLSSLETGMSPWGTSRRYLGSSGGTVPAWELESNLAARKSQPGNSKSLSNAEI